MGTDRRLRLALVGLGTQGFEHLAGSTLSQEVTFVAGVDPSPAAHAHARAICPALRVYEEIEGLAGDAASLALDGLVMCLPHNRYAGVWGAACRLGLPILKEKPLGRTVEEARDFVSNADGRVRTAIQRRHHPAYVRLRHELLARGASIQEVSAWLHLGRAGRDVAAGTWRGRKRASGGGVLLDAGYHVIDLVHYLAGPFDLVSCVTLRDGRRAEPHEIESDARLLGRSEGTWVMIDARVGGHADEQGIPRKDEGVVLATSAGTFRANRSGVWHGDTALATYDREWAQSMATQLDAFASDIRANAWHSDNYWDQLPAMRLIEQAYQLAARY